MHAHKACACLPISSACIVKSSFSFLFFSKVLSTSEVQQISDPLGCDGFSVPRFMSNLKCLRACLSLVFTQGCFFLSPGDPRQTVTLETNKTASAMLIFTKALWERRPTFYLGRQQLQRLWIGQPAMPLFTNGAKMSPLCSFSLDCLRPVCLKEGTLWRWMAREHISTWPSADQWRYAYLPMGTIVTPYNGYLGACWLIASRSSLILVG